MTFDFDAFKEMLENIHTLRNFIAKGKNADPKSIQDPKIRNLSIVSHLYNIDSSGENLSLEVAREYPDKSGLRAIVTSSNDWNALDTPVYTYEIAHLPSGEEYVREVHLDGLAVQLFNGIPATPKFESYVLSAINNAEDGNHLKHRLIAGDSTLELWKVGVPDKGYTLVLAAEEMFTQPSHQYIFSQYLKDALEKFSSSSKLQKNPNFNVQELWFSDHTMWYNVGTIPIDPEFSAKEAQRRIKTRAGKHFVQVMSGDYTNAPELLTQNAPGYNARQIALMLHASNLDNQPDFAQALTHLKPTA